MQADNPSRILRVLDEKLDHEAAWMIEHDRIRSGDLMVALDVAKVPQEGEIPELFAQARPLVLARAYDS